MNLLSDLKIAVIGAGNLGTALIHGLIDSGVPEDSIYVRASTDTRTHLVAEKIGVQAGGSNLDVASAAQIVILAIKPQKMAEVLQELSGLKNAEQLFISVAAGISCAQIENGIAPAAGDRQTPPRVMRAMPNTPALVKKGATGLCKGRYATVEDAAQARALFENVGLVVDVDESLMNVVTGLSGSGPAYVMRFVESMVAAGERNGLSSLASLQLVTQTIHGSMVLLAQSPDGPAALRQKVTSPKGTTMAGLAALDRFAFDEAVEAAVSAARARADELGEE